MSHSVSASSRDVPYTVSLSDGSHHWLSDVAPGQGGGDAGPGPHEILLSALGACTAITLGMYARRKTIALSGIDVLLDILQEDGSPRTQTRIARTLTLHGDLSDAQRQRLLEIADACPIHRLLAGDVTIETRLQD
ncbi:OsmC family protein [Paludibacterium yongneupense]|uniref:OsmC family protein n=1 Tax=Paludibacterium yongneupense TaxID=400061 RepID=UPI00048B9D97|nr:OsmC family protein [Paludibacterium yongneupense]